MITSRAGKPLRNKAAQIYKALCRMLCPAAEATLAEGMPPVSIESFIATALQRDIPFVAQIADDNLHNQRQTPKIWGISNSSSS
jgi:hypothetical protein